ncbi:alpha-L-fucosidase-domain-containing protein [Zopfochytrium polystomum]|nr:alpha-L-fucosidase-domain-containing protein [Zopfochytrium polystomum]
MTRMRPSPRATAAVCALLVAAAAAVTARQDYPAPENSGSVRFVNVDLTSAFNNRGVASSAEQLSVGSFNGRGDSFAAEGFPTGVYQVYNIPYQFRNAYGDGNYDNVWCNGQNVVLPAGRYYGMKIMAAADPDWGSLSSQTPGTFVFHFDDGTTYSIDSSVAQWNNWEYMTSSEFVGPYRWTTAGKVGGPMLKDGTSLQNRTQIYSLELPIAYSSAKVVSVDVPKLVYNPVRAWHIFAATLVTSPALMTATTSIKPALFVERVQATQRWDDVEGERVQFVEVTIVNTPSTSGGTASFQGSFTVEVTSATGRTPIPVNITRLAVGSFVLVDVPIVGGDGTAESALVTVRDTTTGSILVSSNGWTYTPGLTDYDATDESLSRVQAPNWWRDAKVGVMVHWGPYSVPAFGNGHYAEWYFNALNGDQPTRNYHTTHYGQQFPYDGFFDNFTAAAFDAADWISLIENSGGRYIIPTSKHHDGFALFDTGATSNRNAINYGPKRDLLMELHDATLHTSVTFGTYFSLTEWYNPIQSPYGFGAWPGGPPQNPFTKEVVPYVGLVNVSDFIDGIQTPQMQILIEDYRTNIMWCDIGGPSRSCETLAAWYNVARARGEQVLANSRCGCLWNAFSTPEYATYPGIVQHPWETNLGLAPFSYGFDAAVPDSGYKTAKDLVPTLVDVVSKNGNFLIDFGPRADGSISQPQRDGLTGMGAWLKVNGDAIYGTRYWLAGIAQEGNWRFTTKDSAFYLISLAAPNSSYTFSSPIPVLQGDTITALADGSAVAYTLDANNKLTINPTAAQIAAGSIAWAYKITYMSQPQVTTMGGSSSITSTASAPRKVPTSATVSSGLISGAERRPRGGFVGRAVWPAVALAFATAGLFV